MMTNTPLPSTRLSQDELETMPVRDILSLLNAHLRQLDLVPCENDWSHLLRDQGDGQLPAYRWLDVTVVRGSNEGWYLHLTCVPRQHDRVPSILIATAKGYDRAHMWRIAEATAIFLDT